MDDILRDFLAKNESLLNVAPLDFFENHVDKGTGAENGIHIAWLMGWGAANGCLVPELQRNFPLKALLDEDVEGFLPHCRLVTDGALKASCFDPPFTDFVQHYYQPGWRYDYLSDLDALWPDLESYGELKHSLNAFEKVRRLLNERFKQYSEK